MAAPAPSRSPSELHTAATSAAYMNRSRSLTDAESPRLGGRTANSHGWPACQRTCAGLSRTCGSAESARRAAAVHGVVGATRQHQHRHAQPRHDLAHRRRHLPEREGVDDPEGLHGITVQRGERRVDRAAQEAQHREISRSGERAGALGELQQPAEVASSMSGDRGERNRLCTATAVGATLNVSMSSSISVSMCAVATCSACRIASDNSRSSG